MSRTLVVGFDGAPLELARRWMDEGRMPALGALCRDGAFGPMRSVFPYNSAVAWASLSTGVNPGRHGIFDFLLPREGDYQLRVATREDRRAPALWNRASEAGARAAVINIPMTFPAEHVNGIMVSGMDAPGLDERAVYPATYLETLRRSAPGYRIISNAAKEASRGAWDAAERELIDTLVARSSLVVELARPRDLDLLMVNLEATDGAHHFFWQHHDPTHPRHDPVLARRFGETIARVYEATDRELGRIIDAFSPDTVFVVSDHGGGPTNDWLLFLNDWLAAEGFLSVSPTGTPSLTRRLYGELRGRLPVSVRRSLRPLLGRAVDRARQSALYGDVDWSRSRAYAQMQAGVRLNLLGREPSGTVAPDEADAELEELRARALRLRLGEGEPAFAAVRRSEDVYDGDAPGGWDLILELAPGLHVRSRNTTSRGGFLHRLADTGMYLPSGIHTPVGMVAAAGAGIEPRGLVGETDIHQVAASVLAVLGVPAPALDGPPFGFVSAEWRMSDAEPTDVQNRPTDFSQEEEAEVLERLRGLGYVD
ncbi:MAG: alkaline phosphatase family protein [Actinobacteria bacterium]|nr:alkaline phosphatase family protein [Actinomycetota bacterium]